MSVFVLTDSQKLVEMQPTQFASEADFQELLSGFPDLLSGDQIDSDTPRRWLLGAQGSETLWQKMKTNLQAGKIRLLFVADQIPSELRRIVEFLNKQMTPAEVLALELRQFQGEGLKTIVPVVYGQTEEAKGKKGAGLPPRLWDADTFFAACEQRNGPLVLDVAKKLANWMEANADQIAFGRGSKDGSMIMVVKEKGQNVYPLSIWTYGRVEIAFQYLM
jgi:hypothetical protein